MKQVNIEDMEEPTGYNVSLCFEWMDFDSCMTFEIVTDGNISEKIYVVEDLIDAWDGIVEMDDGTIVNLHQFKMAYVTKNEDNNVDITKKPTMQIVH